MLDGVLPVWVARGPATGRPFGRRPSRERWAGAICPGPPRTLCVTALCASTFTRRWARAIWPGPAPIHRCGYGWVARATGTVATIGRRPGERETGRGYMSRSGFRTVCCAYPRSIPVAGGVVSEGGREW